MNDGDDDEIVGWKRKRSETSSRTRAKLSLNADELQQKRNLDMLLLVLTTFLTLSFGLYVMAENDLWEDMFELALSL